MKYSARDDRQIRSKVKNTAPYPSRRSIKKKYDVTRAVEDFGNTLGNFDMSIIDRYYMPGHIPARDIMTELGEVKTAFTPNKISFVLMMLGILLLFNS